MATCQQGHRSHWRFRLEQGGYTVPGTGVWSEAIAVEDGGDGFIRGDESVQIGGIGGISPIGSEKVRKQAGGTLNFQADYDILNWFMLAFMGNAQAVVAEAATLWDNFYDPVDDMPSLELEGRKGNTNHGFPGGTWNRLTFSWQNQDPLIVELEAFANQEALTAAAAQPIKTARTVLPRQMSTFLIGSDELRLAARSGQIVMTRNLDPVNFPAAYDGRDQPCPGGYLMMSGTVGLYYSDLYMTAGGAGGQLTNYHNEPSTQQLQLAFANGAASPDSRAFEIICPRAQITGDEPQFSSPGVVEVSLAWEAKLGDIAADAFGSVGTGSSPAFTEVPGVAWVSGPFDSGSGFG